MADKVFTVTDYYDGPRKGVAEYLGKPHVYESLWDDEQDDWSEFYLLQPITNDTLKLVLEDWEIWRKWERAFDSGKTTGDTHPALPEDKDRNRELEKVLEPLLKIDQSNAIKARAEFEPLTTPEIGMKEMVVTWQAI